MTAASFPPLFSAVLFALFGFFVFQQNPRSPVNKAYLYFCVTTVAWQGTWAYLFNIKEPVLAGTLIRIGYSAIVFLPIAFYQFNISFLGLYEREKKILILYHAIGFFFLFSIWKSNYFVNGYYHFTWGYYPKAGLPLHPLYLAFLSYLAVRPDYLIIRLIQKNQENPIRTYQLRYVFLANIVYTLASLDFGINYGLKIYPFGVVAITISISIIAYAILRHKLLEFNLLIRLGLAYTIAIALLFLLSLPMFFISEKLSKSIWNLTTGTVTVIIISLLVLVFDPLKKRIMKLIDELIFKSTDLQAILKSIEETISKANSIHELTADITGNLQDICNAERAGLVLWDYKLASYRTYPPSAFVNQLITRIGQNITKADFLIKTLESERRLFWQGIILEDEVTDYGLRSSAGERITFWKIRRTMRWLGATACVPIFLNADLIGFIVLGKKRGNLLYNNEDKKLLSHVSELLSESIHSYLIKEL